MTNKKRRLYLSIKNHRLSRLIHGTPTTGYGRRKRERHTQRCQRYKTHHHHEEKEDDSFSGGGFNHYGDIDATANGWNEGWVRRLLERNIPAHELSLPNEPQPILDARYLSTQLACLPTGLYKNLLNQGIKR